MIHKKTLVTLIIYLLNLYSILLAQDKNLFSYKGQKNWQDYWFLDGEKSKLSCKEGLELYAGPTFRDHAAHTVLWTQKTFEGPIQIDYEYTRLDTTPNVLTLYTYMLKEQVKMDLRKT